MATVGLKVQGSGLDGSFSLADTLAKAAFGDPEGIMKARLMASQVGAHDAYAANLAEKTREDAIAQHNRDVAGPAAGDALALAVPTPAPAIVANPPVAGPSGWDTIGATHSEAPSPDEVARVDKLRAANRALGPIIVNGNPEQVAKGFNTQYGGAVLSGAIGNPKIVSPDSLRLASTLYTGSAPTTSTVMVSGDNAGVDAKAREDILTERAKPVEPKSYTDQPYITTIGPDGKPMLAPVPGYQPKAKDATYFDLNGHRYRQNPDGTTATEISGVAPPKPDEPKTFTGQDGKTYIWGVDPTTGKPVAQLVEGVGAAPPKPVQLDEKSFVPNADGTGYVTPKTDRPLITEDPPDPGSEKGRGQILRNVMAIATAPVVDPLRPPPKPTPQQARDYDQAYTTNYGAQTQFQNINGVPTPVRVWPSRPGFYSPKDIYKLAGIDPPAPLAGSPEGVPAGGAGQPVQTGGTGPAGAHALPTPVTTGGGDFGIDVGQGLGKPKPPEVTEARGKARSFASSAALAETRLANMTTKDIPGTYQSILATNPSPNWIMALAKSNTENAGARKWANSMWQFTNAINRHESGANITDAEWATARELYIPVTGDRPVDIKRKQVNRINKINGLVAEGWLDPDEVKNFRDEWGPQGVNFDARDEPAKPKPKPKSSDGNPASKFFR